MVARRQIDYVLVDGVPRIPATVVDEVRNRRILLVEHDMSLVMRVCETSTCSTSLLSRPLEAYTADTITNPLALDQELGRIRERSNAITAELGGTAKLAV